VDATPSDEPEFDATDEASRPAEYCDALPAGPLRGRGAGLNPGNRFESLRLHILGEHLDDEAAARASGGDERPKVATTVLDDDSRSILNRVDSPDLHMKWTLNPYRGCEHGCIYCYARPTHEYLGLSSGLDFETKILAKHEAPDLLRDALRKPSWLGEGISMSGVTDPYQPVERDLRITRRCLEVMAEFRQAVSVITKNRLLLRDLDLLQRLHAHGAAHAAVSITTLDPDLAAAMEPRASSPKARLETVRQIAATGIPVWVMVAPVVPGLTDREMPAILEAAAEAGASGAGYVLLRLPHQIKALFLEWLARHVPARAAHVESLLRQMHGGDLYEAAWKLRQTGRGPFADQLAQTFRVFTKRHGLDRPHAPINTAAFLRPPVPGDQLGLFP